jgi:predicted ATP-grasp superfamily ATP-dependent carboligase
MLSSVSESDSPNWVPGGERQRAPRNADSVGPLRSTTCTPLRILRQCLEYLSGDNRKGTGRCQRCECWSTSIFAAAGAPSGSCPSAGCAKGGRCSRRSWKIWPRCLRWRSESDGALHQRCRWVEASGGRLLGPSAEAVALTSDKFTLNQLLAQQDIPVPDARLLTGEQLPLDFNYPAVLKPRFGAGSEEIFLVEQGGISLADVRPEYRGSWQQQQGQAVLEEYVAGQPASVSFLVGPSGAVPLLVGLQRLSDDGRFAYQGGRMPLLGPEALAALAAAGRAVAALAPSPLLGESRGGRARSLRGFVGVDVVLSQPAADTAPIAMPTATVIEINPRLTTSYVGLRALARGNVAAWMLEVLEGRQPRVAWQPGEVDFDVDGTVRRVGRGHENG